MNGIEWSTVACVCKRKHSSAKRRTWRAFHSPGRQVGRAIPMRQALLFPQHTPPLATPTGAGARRHNNLPPVSLISSVAFSPSVLCHRISTSIHRPLTISSRHQVINISSHHHHARNREFDTGLDRMDACCGPASTHRPDRI